MEKTPGKNKDKVLNANIKMHTILANTYDNEQPHYFSENKKLVSSKLNEIAEKAGNELLIDFGCGTGFCINLAVSYYDSVIGVDVTEAMLSKVDLSSGKVKLFNSNTENVPLESNIADVVTANSFLHHLYDIKPTIKEAYRLLKKGGVFYSEEDPNYFYWKAIKDPKLMNNYKHSELFNIGTEISSTLNAHHIIAEEKNIEPNIVKYAEYQKMVEGGMRTEELFEVFNDIGFTKIDIKYYWFFGQAKIMHQSSELSMNIETYLHSIMPLSKHLFKYLKIEAWK